MGTPAGEGAKNVGSESETGKPAGRWEERIKSVVCLCTCVGAMFSNSLLLSTTHDLSKWKAALPDQVYEVVSEQGWALKAGDISTGLLAVLLIGLCIFHSAGLVLFRRVTTLLGFMYGLRAFVLPLTTLSVPFENPTKNCLNQTGTFRLGQILRNAALSFFTAGAGSGAKIPCGDLFFSGHTIVLTLSPCFSQLYLPRSLRLLILFKWLVSFFGMTAMIISRGHYTIDIVASFVISRAVFALYHAFTFLPHPERDAVRLGRISCLILYAQWLECRSPFGPPPTLLRWPLPWPACARRAFARLFPPHHQPPHDDHTPLSSPTRRLASHRAPAVPPTARHRLAAAAGDSAPAAVTGPQKIHPKPEPSPSPFAPAPDDHTLPTTFAASTLGVDAPTMAHSTASASTLASASA